MEGSTFENTTKFLNMQQNKVVHICIDKNNLGGSTKINFKEFGVLPINVLLYKKLSIMFLIKKLSISYDIYYSNSTYNIIVIEHRYCNKFYK